MIRIRFHGRGGHGIKTASRIVGTAAFLSGLQTQDSPIYGAERRGAAIAAFTRIDSEPILERGVITQPDLIIAGDESLLGDAGAGVLLGQEFARALFINTKDANALISRYEIEADVVTTDITALTLEKIGKASALSAGLGAAAARLTGVISRDYLLQATDEELRLTGLSDDQIGVNLTVAAGVFDTLKSVEDFASGTTRARVADASASIPHHDSVLSTPSILAAGNSDERQTGTWRVERPEIDYDICTRCGICFVRCPDGAIALNVDGYPIIDYDHCKGCMECWEQCPIEGAIRKEKEVRAW